MNKEIKKNLYILHELENAMVREIKVPLLEGLSSTGPTTMRIYDHNEIPIKIGSLEKEAFSYISDWNLLMNDEGYGIIYRLGTKNIKNLLKFYSIFANS